MAEKGKMEQVLRLNEEKYRKDNAKRIDKLKREPKVGVYGNPLYKQALGDVYSFTYQDYPVTIVFDGRTYLYPKTIAALIQEKLNAAAKANTPKESSEIVVF